MFSSQYHAFYYISKLFKIAGFYIQKNFQKNSKWPTLFVKSGFCFQLK